LEGLVSETAGVALEQNPRRTRRSYLDTSPWVLDKNLSDEINSKFVRLTRNAEYFSMSVFYTREVIHDRLYT
jgi:hypothetical protein